MWEIGSTVNFSRVKRTVQGGSLLFYFILLGWLKILAPSLGGNVDLSELFNKRG
jgi:hypothetical protein